MTTKTITTDCIARIFKKKKIAITEVMRYGDLRFGFQDGTDLTLRAQRYGGGTCVIEGLLNEHPAPKPETAAAAEGSWAPLASTLLGWWKIERVYILQGKIVVCFENKKEFYFQETEGVIKLVPLAKPTNFRELYESIRKIVHKTILEWPDLEGSKPVREHLEDRIMPLFRHLHDVKQMQIYLNGTGDVVMNVDRFGPVDTVTYQLTSVEIETRSNVSTPSPGIGG